MNHTCKQNRRIYQCKNATNNLLPVNIRDPNMTIDIRYSDGNSCQILRLVSLKVKYLLDHHLAGVNWYFAKSIVY